MNFRPDFSHLTPAARFVLLMFVLLFCLVFSTLAAWAGAALLWGKDAVQGFDPANMEGNSLAALKFMQIINHTGIFLCTGLLYQYLVNGSAVKGTGFIKIPDGRELFLMIMILVTTLPWISSLYQWNRSLSLSSFQELERILQEAESEARQLMDVFLREPTPAGIAVNLLMVCVLPAVGEEILFRGVLQNLFRQWWKNGHLAVWISALLFSAIHMQFYGFFPRMALGVILGYMVLFTGKLWLPVIAHFLNNFMAWVAFMSTESTAGDTSFEEIGFTGSIWISAGSLVLTFSLMWVLWKLRCKGRTTTETG